jgi:F420-dependent oxidoreductase-like protein
MDHPRAIFSDQRSVPGCSPLEPTNLIRPLARQPTGGQAAVRPATTRGGDVRLGLSVGYWGFGITQDEQVAMAIEAERLGFDSVWAAEAYGSDAATVLAWLAAKTTSIGIGSAVFQMPARSPAMTAMTAATLDRLSKGRFRLGLGLSGPQVAEGWHGQRYARPLARTRDYVAVVRLALARKRVQYQGETIDLPLPDGPGKALRLTISPARDHLPIYLATMGPKNTALAGEVADGWLPYLFAPEFVAGFRRHLADGAARAGRTLDGFDVAPSVCVHISDDLEMARNAMRVFLALYVGGMGSREQNFYNRLVRSYGFEEAAETVQELYLSGRQAEAMAALPGELIDLLTLCGPASRVRERLAAYRDAGVGTLIVLPIAATASDRLQQLRLVADLAEP